MTLGYGKSVMGNIGNLVAEVEYSEMFIQSVKNVNMVSKNSDFTISKAYDMILTNKYDSYQLGVIIGLVNQGNYDSFKIDAAKSVEIESKYSTVIAQYLDKSLDAKMSYGQINIYPGAQEFDLASIDSKNTEIY